MRRGVWDSESDVNGNSSKEDDPGDDDDDDDDDDKYMSGLSEGVVGDSTASLRSSRYLLCFGVDKKPMVLVPLQ